MASQGASLYMTKPFKEGSSSHGGHHRYQQLKELVINAGLPLAGEIAATQRGDLTQPEQVKTMVAGLSNFPISGFGSIPSLAGLFRIGAAGVALRELQRSDVFLWAPSYGSHLVLGRLARRKGARVIALIHNIESLVPNQPCPIRSSRSEWHDLELSYLSDPHVIFCHSRWDQWYLRLRGLAARLLPYYPAKSRYESLHKFRERRSSSRSDDSIVVLGNAHNAPTWLGMLEQLKMIRRHSDALKNIEFHFFGERTEGLHSQKLTPNVHVHGYVDEDVLRDYLANAKAVWFHQPPTTGVVTRIVDMLIAGVPVLANGFAARSQEALNGVHAYDLEEAVPALIHSNLTLPELPDRPHRFAQEFVETVAALVNGTFSHDGSG